MFDADHVGLSLLVFLDLWSFEYAYLLPLR
jgi:hypothetical protein